MELQGFGVTFVRLTTQKAQMAEPRLVYVFIKGVLIALWDVD